MSPVRRTATVAPPPQVVEEMLDILNLSSYAGGKTIPEGDYAVEFIAQEHQSINQAGQAVGKPRTVVMLVSYPLAGGDPIEQPLGLGQKAILSWVPTADGKGFAKRAGGPGMPPTNKSNWLLFYDSMVQCMDPSDVEAVKGQNLTVLDGIWMHIKPVPEPEERKTYRKNAVTGEAGQEPDDEPRGNGMIPQCTGILDGGKPWLGGGGFQSAPAAPPVAPSAARVNRRVPAPAPAAPTAPAPVARRMAAVPPPPPPPAAEEGDEETLESAALSCIGDVLLKPEFARGLKRMKLRMEVHGAAVAKYGDETATDILTTYFSDEKALANMLGAIDYKLSGAGPQQDVVPVK